ncbi:MAG: cupredoxin domain-containing protein, partial [Planctomycetota bacterium]
MRWGRLTGVALATGLTAWLGAGLLNAQATPPDGDDKAGSATAKADKPAAAGKCTISGTLVFPAAAKKRRRVRRRYPGQAPGAKKAKKAAWFPAVVFVENITAAPVGKEVVATMNQEGIAFDPPILAVRDGTTVTFPNLDPVYHNVLSYSTAKRFDLGRYPKGETRTVRFEQQGVVRLACEIHEHMKGFIVVLRHPHFATTDAKGAFTLGGL